MLLILSARVKCLKGELEHDKDDYQRKVWIYYTEGIELKCKDEKMNAELSIALQLSVEGWLARIALILLFGDLHLVWKTFGQSQPAYVHFPRLSPPSG